MNSRTPEPDDRWGSVWPTLTVAGIGLGMIFLILLVGDAVTGSSIFGWDLSSFVPDMIVAATTGILIAVFVLFAERRITERREALAARREALTQWSRLSARVRASLWVQLWYGVNGFRSPDEVLAKFDGFLDLARAYPLEAWADAAPHDVQLKAVGNAARVILRFEAAISAAKSRAYERDQNLGSGIFAELIYRWESPKGHDDDKRLFSDAQFDEDPIFHEATTSWDAFQTAWQDARTAMGLPHVS